MKIKIGIAGYGNLGRGVEAGINQNDDMELVAVFTRRNPESLKIQSQSAKVYGMDEIEKMVDTIDVMILCGGSATDLPEQGPALAKLFNTVDSFDTHAKIPEYYEKVNVAATENKHVSIISVGWDPGMFSVNRLYSEAILPQGNHYTFWGTGVSQGHSDAIRRIPGVKNAIQYTIPVDDAIQKVRDGKDPELSIREKHTRLCYVVAEENADKQVIETTIKTMPNYFSDYDTTVEFITEEKRLRDHGKINHGGFVIRSGKTGINSENHHIVEYSLKLDSNPEFTASVLIAYARAAHRLAEKEDFGCKTVFDIAPGLLSIKSPGVLREELL
ncbi:MAG: diaminopimelate dehydrogenase [Eubacteriaceae bacterium]